MKKLFLLTAFVCLTSIVSYAQKKYEMVIEKTDGTNIVVNTEDILRTYFRERTGGETPQPAAIDIVGTWYVYESDVEGLDGIWTFNSDGTGTIEEFYHGESEGVDRITYTFSGNRLSFYYDGEEDDPSVFDINVVSNDEFTWTDGHDTLTFKRQGGGGGSQPQAYLTCPDSNHPHMIDLGLPSGTKWACCNVGATTPEGNGGFYAWGETDAKTEYSWNTYIHCDGDMSSCKHLGNSICGTQYDVAHVKWGGSWQMPTADEIRELLKNCQKEFTTQNGIKGLKIIGPQGNSIFLPAVGYMNGTSIPYNGITTHYWSGMLEYGEEDAQTLCFDYNDEVEKDGRYRYMGVAVRPVSNGNTPTLQPLQLSSSSISLTVGNQDTVDITSGNGNYTTQSSNSSVATATVNNSKVVISGISAGTAAITVTDTQSNQTANIDVSVTGGTQPQGYLTCPDSNHPHMIDLGLPSGTKWACCNVGANKPEGYGGYYAWGETDEKTTNNWSNYIHCDGSYDTCHDLGSDIAGTQYDVAHVKWGGSWVMPSSDQMGELLDNCISEWTTNSGVYGRQFTSKSNGGSVFLPAAGYRWDDGLSYAGSSGYYWSSTQLPSYSGRAYILDFDSSGAYWSGYDFRFGGHTVRPVSK